METKENYIAKELELELLDPKTRKSPERLSKLLSNVAHMPMS